MLGSDHTREKLASYALLLLPVLSVTQSHMLEFGEALRSLLVAIGLGTWALAVRSGRDLSARAREAVLITSLSLIYVVTVFDPLTSGANSEAQSHVYLIAYLLCSASAWSLCPARLSGLGATERAAAIAIVVVSVLSVVSGIIEGVLSDSIKIGLAKLMTFMVIWTTTRRCVEAGLSGHQPALAGLPTRVTRLVGVVLLVSCAVAGLRWYSMERQFGEVRALILDGKHDTAIAVLSAAQENNWVLGVRSAGLEIVGLAVQIAKATGDSSSLVSAMRAMEVRYPEGAIMEELGDIYLDIGDPDRAAEMYARALSLMRDDRRLLANLGQAHLDRGEIQALASLMNEYGYLEGLVASSQTERAALGRLALWYGKNEAASRLLRHVVDDTTEDQGIQYLYGRSKLGVGDVAGAVRPLRMAVAGPTHIADAGYYLGLAYETLGRADQAHREFERAIQWLPEHLGASAKITGHDGPQSGHELGCGIRVIETKTTRSLDSLSVHVRWSYDGLAPTYPELLLWVRTELKTSEGVIRLSSRRVPLHPQPSPRIAGGAFWQTIRMKRVDSPVTYDGDRHTAMNSDRLHQSTATVLRLSLGTLNNHGRFQNESLGDGQAMYIDL